MGIIEVEEEAGTGCCATDTIPPIELLENAATQVAATNGPLQ